MIKTIGDFDWKIMTDKNKNCEDIICFYKCLVFLLTTDSVKLN